MSGGRGRSLVLFLTCALVALTPALGTGSASAVPRRESAQTITLLKVPACSAFLGARKLGAKMNVNGQTVYACGPRPNYAGLLGRLFDVLATVFPYRHSIARYPGYQCVELTSRYLAAAYGAHTGPGTVNGAQVVDNYARRYPNLFRKFANGNRRHPPQPGDVISFSTNPGFHGVGHTGVVAKSSISRKGNGHIVVMEQNYGGKTGKKGWHTYHVKHFRVIWKQKPYMKWLHRRS
ncbi:MAG TPA: CHAP domain-containing protein [Marmoricola sp.]